jgi:hypothetical protein
MTVANVGCNFSVARTRVKYLRLEPNRYEYEQYLALRCISNRVLDFRSHSYLHGYHDSKPPVRRGLLTQSIQFFMSSPKLEVKIAKATTLSPDVIKSGFNPRSDGKLPEVKLQSLILTARRSSIERLGNKVLLRSQVVKGVHYPYEQEYPMHLKWASYDRTVDSLTGRMIIREPPPHIVLEKDEPHVVWIWNAKRFEGEYDDATFEVNIDPTLSIKLKEAKVDAIEFDIQFLPVEKNMRKFRLNVKSWDELSLTERE